MLGASDTVGDVEGPNEGSSLGRSEGKIEGDVEGDVVRVGEFVGSCDGVMLGRLVVVGWFEIVGAKLGKKDGIILGTLDVGERDGSSDGAILGKLDFGGLDNIEGFADGASEAVRVGEKETMAEIVPGGGAGTMVGPTESVTEGTSDIVTSR